MADSHHSQVSSHLLLFPSVRGANLTDGQRVAEPPSLTPPPPNDLPPAFIFKFLPNFPFCRPASEYEDFPPRALLSGVVEVNYQPLIPTRLSC